MIPLGTGLFKTMYDTKKHNETIKSIQEKKEKEIKNNNNLNGVKSHSSDIHLYGNRDNIIEEKLMRSTDIIDKYKIKSILDFNMIDLIN